MCLLLWQSGLEKHPQQMTPPILEKGPAMQQHCFQQKQWTLPEIGTESEIHRLRFIHGKWAFNLCGDCDKIRKYYMLLTSTKQKLLLENNKNQEQTTAPFNWLGSVCQINMLRKEGKQGITS